MPRSGFVPNELTDEESVTPAWDVETSDWPEEREKEVACTPPPSSPRNAPLLSMSPLSFLLWSENPPPPGLPSS